MESEIIGNPTFGKVCWRANSLWLWTSPTISFLASKSLQLECEQVLHEFNQKGSSNNINIFLRRAKKVLNNNTCYFNFSKKFITRRPISLSFFEKPSPIHH